MAENERFEIVKLKQLDCEKCKAINKLMKKFKDCPKDCSNKLGKTREEYESIILKTIDFELNKVLNGVNNITNIQVAKAVCDELFGKSK